MHWYVDIPYRAEDSTGSSLRARDCFIIIWCFDDEVKQFSIVKQSLWVDISLNHAMTSIFVLITHR